MAAPFGFSAGDFVAGLHLLNKAISALRDSDGASSHFRHAILELESISFTLKEVQNVEPTGATLEIVEKLQFWGHQCYIHIDTFVSKIKKLTPELGKDQYESVQTKWQKYGKKPMRQVQWSLQHQKHLSELKAAIAPHLAAIGILLQLTTL